MCFFPSSNGQESSAGLAMKHKCSSASSCSQKRHTRWHVSWPLRPEALRAVSSAAVRISACVPLFPTVTPRAEKPHARSLPSPPRRHIRHLRGISWVGAPPSSTRPGSLPLSHFRMNPIRVEIATLIEQLQGFRGKGIFGVQRITDADACNELRMLIRHRAVRKDTHAGPQRIRTAAAPSCGQKRHTRWPATNSVLTCAQ